MRMAAPNYPEETPPNLQEWRERLFHAAETIPMTEDEYNLDPQLPPRLESSLIYIVG